MDNLAKDLPPVAVQGPGEPQVPSPPKSVQAVEVTASQDALPGEAGAGGERSGHAPQDCLRWSKGHEDRLKINHLGCFPGSAMSVVKFEFCRLGSCICGMWYGT